MIRSMWAAASGMQAQTMNIDVIANNLANVTTTGYKRSRAEFQDLLYETMQPPGGSTSENTQAPTGIQLGHGVRPVAIAKNFSEGELQMTKNELDLAIEGNGFFQVTQSTGTTAYTRAGAFKLDKDGRIVTSDGLLLNPEISVPSDAISLSVGVDGTVSVLQAGDSNPPAAGHHPARAVHQPGRASEPRQEPVPADRRLRHGHHGHGRRQQLRHDRPGVPRELERERRRRDGQHDHGPAGLRDQQQGRAGLGRHAPDRQQPETVGPHARNSTHGRGMGEGNRRAGPAGRGRRSPPAPPR